jgi:hypothetical protein
MDENPQIREQYAAFLAQQLLLGPSLTPHAGLQV